MQKLPHSVPRPPRFIPAYNCKSVQIIYSAECVLLPLKKNKTTAVNVFLLLLPQKRILYVKLITAFALIFHFKLCSFC